MVIDAFLACLFNVHYLIFLSMVHEYAYFYEYIWKSVYKPLQYITLQSGLCRGNPSTQKISRE